jgi:hypothetical protein
MLSTHFSCQILMKLGYKDRFFKNTEIRISMKVPTVKAQLFQADEQTDIHEEAIMRKRLKIGIKGRCALYEE